MENREKTSYIVLANVHGRKTAIQLDGLYTILPPQNFPSQLPKEIQYKDERLPLYQARQVIGFYEKEYLQKGPYEKLYRDLLVKVKEVSDEISRLKKRLFSESEEGPSLASGGSAQAASRDFSSIVAATEEASSKMRGLTENIRKGRGRMAEKFTMIKEGLEELRRYEEQLLKGIDEIEGMNSENGSNLSSIAASLVTQSLAHQKFEELTRLQEEIENKLISMLFDFGIKLRREENPDDENIKRGEQMLALLQGDNKEVINQEEVDQLLSEFLK